MNERSETPIDKKPVDEKTKYFHKSYRTVTQVTGPLIVVEQVTDVSFGEIVSIKLASGELKNGQVLECGEGYALVQVFEGTDGIDVDLAEVTFLGEVAKIDVAPDILGRVLNGRGIPVDGGPEIIPTERREVNGSPINPYSRVQPNDFIQTGISAIDGFNTLVRGQKLPIFSGAGLPANELTAQIIDQAGVRGGGDFAIVFAAMGITQREASFFRSHFERSGSLERVVFLLNLANDPTIERILTPRCALTIAEYLAFSQNLQVLVILTDMTNYCEALRELSTAREEIPGRRGYPGYLYTDLANLYERAGMIKDCDGSITQLIILSMPDDDITHPIPDLTGYITEGQIVISRDLHRRGIYPPIDILPSLSRLINQGIGAGKTREDHRSLIDQVYSAYAKGRDLRKLVSIIGEEALSEIDRLYLKFADDFENRLICQGNENRDIEDTLNMLWEMIARFPREEMKKLSDELVDKYMPAETKIPDADLEPAEEEKSDEEMSGVDMSENEKSADEKSDEKPLSGEKAN